jgi:hypothetical protein
MKGGERDTPDVGGSAADSIVNDGYSIVKVQTLLISCLESRHPCTKSKWRRAESYPPLTSSLGLSGINLTVSHTYIHEVGRRSQVKGLTELTASCFVFITATLLLDRSTVPTVPESELNASVFPLLLIESWLMQLSERSTRAVDITYFVYYVFVIFTQFKDHYSIGF